MSQASNHAELVANQSELAFVTKHRDTLAKALNVCLQYLEHPDVKAIPFAVRSEVAAQQVRSVLA